MSSTERRNRWFFGGISSAAAACFTHPLDLIKVHLQTQEAPKKTIGQTMGVIYNSGGIKGFYKGISASLVRQLTYATTRFAIYESGKQFIDAKSVGQTVALATIAGFCGGIVGVPFDMINVRMQNDAKLPVDKRRNYKHVFNGLYRVTKEEGVHSLFRGGSIAISRGIMVTIGQNAVYDNFKRVLLTYTDLKDNSGTHFLTSLFAGGVATLLTQPLDVMKTRLMNAKPGQYSGIFAVMTDVGKVGPMGFFRGFLPAFTRIGPHTILTFLMMEQLRLYFGYIPSPPKIQEKRN